MTEQLNVLMVEDSENDALLVLRALRKQGFEPIHQRVEERAAMKDALGSRAWDIVLSDFQMPRFSGPAALAVLKETDLDLPFIVISGTMGEEAAIETMRAGAHDYLMKGNLKRLGETVRRELKAAAHREERRLAHRRLAHLNRVLRAIRDINQLIVREKNPEQLIQTACDTLVETRSYRGVWIARGHTGTFGTSIRSAGWDRGFETFSEKVRTGWSPPCAARADAAPDGLARLTPGKDCQECPLYERYGHEVAACAALRHDGERLGVMGVAIPDQNAVDEEEASLLAEVAGDIAFALRGINLDRQRNRYAQIVAGSTEGMALVDRDYNYLEANPAYRSLVGRPESIIAGSPLPEVLGKRFFESTVKPNLDRCFKGAVARFQSELDVPGAEPKIIEAICSPCTEADGTVSTAAVCVRDISELRRAESVARKEAEWSANILASISDAFFVLDENLVVTYFNPAAEGALGREQGEVIGRPLFEVFPEARGSIFEERYSRAVETQRADNFETYFGVEPYADWFDVRVYPLEKGISVYFRVTTEEKAAQEALRESEERFKTITESSADAIFITDERGRYVYVNDAAADLLGYGKAELLRMTITDLSPKDRVDGDQALFEKLLDEGRGFGEIDLVRKNGDITAVELNAVVLPNGLVYGSCRDVTERRNLHAQLAQSDRLSSMGMLAAGVAHEINNPLSYVLYNLETLAEDFPGLIDAFRQYQHRLNDKLGSDKVDDIVGTAAQIINPAMLSDFSDRFRDTLDGTRRIRDIARGLGTFSRVEQNRLVPVQLMHVIEVAINMAYNEVKYRARLVKEYGKIATVYASEGRLSQVFLNLIINAAHAIKEGDVDQNEIRIRTWQEADNVMAEVRDTGSGIAPENMGKLFEPFFTTKEIGAGSGLGLAISKNIVESYGGTISVTSPPGEGTSFIICLPVRQVDPGPSMPPPLVSEAPTERCRVLVVDDEAGIRGAVRRMLRQHETVMAQSGAEARNILKDDQAFDLIICDMMMPEVSGMDLHRWLVDTHPRLAAQFVFITGGAFTPNARDYLAKVNNLRLEKPFDVANFKKIVGELLRNARSDEHG